MFGTGSQIDANFYQLIHQFAANKRAESKRNRRSSSRRPFWAEQRVAPVRGAEIPEESAYIRVRCHDLTRSGFSFFLDEPPEFTRLVAAFGDPPDAICVRAEVIHFEHVLVHPMGTVERFEGKASRPGRVAATGQPAVPMVLVGCRFTGRLEEPSA
jgi:hypothetical protein